MLLFIDLIVAAFGGANSIQQSIKEAEKEREIGELHMEQARANARAKLQQAEQERLERMAEETAERAEDRRAIARMEAMYAKRGVMRSGSVIDVTAEQARVQELNQAAKNRVSLYEQDIRKWQAEGALIQGRNIQGMHNAKADTMLAAGKVGAVLGLFPTIGDLFPKSGLPSSYDMAKAGMGLENNLSKIPIIGGLVEGAVGSVGGAFGQKFDGKQQQIAEANQEITEGIIAQESEISAQTLIGRKRNFGPDKLQKENWRVY